MSKPPFEIFDHTADIGLRVYGQDERALFIHAAQGFYSLITDWESLAAGGPAEEVDIRLEAASLEELFLMWLRELLYYFSAKSLIAIDFAFDKINETSAVGRLRMRRFYPATDEQRYEVKAVTHHAFKIVREKDGLSAQVIFDI